MAAELALQFIPVPRGLQYAAVHTVDPIGHYEPNRRFTYSIGWNFSEVVHGRTNNYGFVNDQDYDRHAETPLLAVVGDSYVESLMVSYPLTVHGRLAAVIGGAGRVYSFGISGSALSQYLAMSRLAASFSPTGMVVVIIGNDFDESLVRFGKHVGMHQFSEAEGRLVLGRTDYVPSRRRRLLGRSALLRYMVFNLQVEATVAALRRTWSRTPSEKFVGNTSGAAEPERVALSKRAVDEFLNQLPAYSGLDPSRILLVLDGRRRELYDKHRLQMTDGSYFDLMRRYLLSAAHAEGFEVADLEPRFIARYQREGTQFEFPSDGHWNQAGHEEAARAVLESRFWTTWRRPEQ